MRISDWSSDVCSSDLMGALMARRSVRILVEDFVKAGGGFRTLAVDAPRSERASLAGISANGESLQARSEEHTSELQSLMRISYAVFCLKKKNPTTTQRTRNHLEKQINNIQSTTTTMI